MSKEEEIIERLERIEKWLVGGGFFNTPAPEIPAAKPISVCSKCGLRLDGAMGYVCSQPDCPCGSGGVTNC